MPNQPSSHDPQPTARRPSNPVGALTLIGSGEFLDTMAKVHRTLLEPYGNGVNAVFIDTPAGFELNCDELAERAIQYFAQRFEVGLSVASYRAPTASPLEISAALRLIGAADYMVAGPGSPPYAVRTWRGSAVWEAVVERYRKGAHLVMASAAAMAIGRRVVPIYEIYRCGEDARWIDGLDLLGPQGIDLAVMPHWNNASGANHDTRFCFMGEARKRQLVALLNPSTVLLGVDEHTACTFDFEEQLCRVEGAGGVTVVAGGSEIVFEAGTTFQLTELVAQAGHQHAKPRIEAPDGVPSGERSPRPVLPRYLAELAAALESEPEAGAHPELIDWIHEATHQLARDWRQTDSLSGQDVAPFVELLERARKELREAKRFTVSDEIRDRLAELGVQPVDPPLSTA